MYKIAMIGVENSHAQGFATMLKNDPEKYGDFEIVGVFSYDGKVADKMVEDGLAPFAANCPDYFLGKVDAVINTARHGDNHYEYSMPYIEAGVPMFIDKPFSVNPQNAKKMIETAREHGAILRGGSSLKFSADIMEFKKNLSEGKYGKLLSASMSAPIFMDSFYANFHFYAAHLAEMLLIAFDLSDSVHAFAHDEAVVAVAHYKDFDVSLHYGGYYYSYTAFCENKCFHKELGNEEKREQLELDEFCNMIRTGVQPEPYEKLTASVSLMDAIYLSFRTGGTEQKVIRI